MQFIYVISFIQLKMLDFVRFKYKNCNEIYLKTLYTLKRFTVVWVVQRGCGELAQKLAATLLAAIGYW